MERVEETERERCLGCGEMPGARVAYGRKHGDWKAFLQDDGKQHDSMIRAAA